jgi:hypothetical protein
MESHLLAAMSRARSWSAVLGVLSVSVLTGCGATPAQMPAQTVAAVTAGPGQTFPRSAVPWRSIGPGWALAEDTAIPVNVSRTVSGSVTLYLVDPQGGRYRLFSWPAKGPAPYGMLTDWSGDGERALFTSGGITDRDPRQAVRQLDLRTGKFTGFTFGGDQMALGYTRPDGTEILVEDPADSATGNDSLVRYSLGGQPQGTVWQAPGIGQVAYAPDGRELVTDSYGNLALLSNTGGVIRQLDSPLLCDPVRWWNRTTILASCAPGGTANDRMWLIPLSGAKGKALTPQRPEATGPDRGDSNLYQISSGTYLNALGPRCGNHVVVRQEPDGKTRTYAIPGEPEAQIVTATATRLLLQEDQGCTTLFPEILAWYDPATGQQTVVVPVSRQDAGVLAVIPYYQQGKF